MKAGYILVATPILILAFVRIVAAEKSEGPTGLEIIESFIAKQSVEAEMALLHMKSYVPGSFNNVVKIHRLLALSVKGDGGANNHLIRIIDPEEVAGVTMLVRESEGGKVNQFIYLPDLGRTVEIRNRDKMNSFLGSDFTYEDLLREIPMNFTYERVGNSFIHGLECFVVRARPVSEEVGSIYSHRDLFIEIETHLIRQIEFYTESGGLTKSLESLDYESPFVNGETRRPRNAVMYNIEKNTVTVFAVEQSRLNPRLDHSLFFPDRIKDWTDQEVAELISGEGLSLE